MCFQMLSFGALELFARSTSLVWSFLFWRLAVLGHKQTFVNTLMAFNFLLNSITSFFCSHFLLELGWSILYVHPESEEEKSYLCTMYLNSYMVKYTLSVYFTLGIIFCRFIYVRHSLRPRTCC